MKHTFRGGVHPAGHKELSREMPLRDFLPAGEMVFPLSQHIGKPAKPIVKKGDSVLVGQRIAEADGYISANIASSCSGTVKAIEKRRVLTGAMADCIVIENDGQFTPAEDYTRRQEPDSVSNEQIISRVQEAGVVGLGGAGFPTCVKLKPKDPQAIRVVIANGAECEPYLTCNDQLMRTKAPEIIEGLELVLRLFPRAKGVVAIEDNKPEAIAAMRQAATGKEKIEVRAMKTKYPQGGERSLIRVIAGVDFPVTMLPADVGCIVVNVGTAYAIGRAVAYNEPLFSHVITVTGEAVKAPANFIARDGTSFAELLAAAGGLKDGVTAAKALTGGPMMGVALSTLDIPIQKTSNALTLLADDPVAKAQAQMTPCLHCGRCSTVCPNGLVPALMADAIDLKNFERYEKKLYGLECIACGCCTFICPAKRPLTQMFKQTKAEIMAQKRAQKAGGKA